MRDFLWQLAPPREGEGGGLGGGDGGGSGGGEGGGWTPPQGLPEQYRGASADETIGKLLGGFSELNTRAEGLRTQLARMPKAPEKPDLYTYEPPDALKPYFGDLAKDPLLPHARAAFHKHGIPQEAFSGIINDIFGPAVEAGLLSQPYDPATEIATFMKEGNLDRTGASRALTEAKTFAEGLFGQLKDVPTALQDDVKAQLVGLTDTAAGNFLLRSLAARLSENGIRIGGDGQRQGELSAEDLKKLDADPRIDPANRDNPDPAKRFDPDLRKRYDEAYRKLPPARNTASW